MDSNNSSSKLRIAFFSALPPFRGGISNFSELLVEQLEKIAIVESFTFKKQYPDFLFPGKSQFNEKNMRLFPRIVSTFNPFSYISARKKMVKTNPDIFITNYWMTFFGPMMAFFASGFERKVIKIAVIHNLIPHEKRFFDSIFNKLFLSKYNGFIVLSQSVKDEVISIRKNAYCLVLDHPPYNQFGPKLERYESNVNLGLNPSKKTILFFGLIREYKGLDILLKAFSFLDDRFQLLIAGEVYGSERKYLDLIEKSKNRNIQFINNFIPDDQVSVYFSSADLCVLPYKSATQSGIKAIADSFGVPVLTTNVGGLAESIIPNENGFIIENNDGHSIAQQIMSIFDTGILQKVIFSMQKINLEDGHYWHDFATDLLLFCQKLNASSKTDLG